MKRLNEVDLGNLVWTQPRFGLWEFELRAGDELVGTMIWPKWLSDLVEAACGDGRWTIDRTDFFGQRVVMRRGESESVVATLEFDWLREGALACSSGRVFNWHRTRAFCNYWGFVDEQSEMVVEIREAMRWFKHEADVVLHAGAEALPELPLLVLMGWYLCFITLRDSVVVTGIS
jgi:hypothetical protein